MRGAPIATLFLSTASLSGLHILQSHNNNSKGQPCSKTNKAVVTRASFGLFVARHRDWLWRPTVTRHPNHCRGGCRSKWNMSQCLLRSDTVIYDAATQSVLSRWTCSDLSSCLSPMQCLSVPSLPISRSLEDAPSLETTTVNGHVNTLSICLVSKAVKLLTAADIWEPLPENATSFLLDSQLSSTGHSSVNNLF